MYIIDYDYLDNLVKRTISEGMYSVEPMIGIMSKIIDEKYDNKKWNDRLRYQITNEIKTYMNQLLSHLKTYELDNNSIYKILCYHCGRLDLYEYTYNPIKDINVEINKEFKRDIKNKVINTVLRVNITYNMGDIKNEKYK